MILAWPCASPFNENLRFSLGQPSTAKLTIDILDQVAAPFRGILIVYYTDHRATHSHSVMSEYE